MLPTVKIPWVNSPMSLRAKYSGRPSAIFSSNSCDTGGIGIFLMLNLAKNGCHNHQRMSSVSLVCYHNMMLEPPLCKAGMTPVVRSDCAAIATPVHSKRGFTTDIAVTLFRLRFVHYLYSSKSDAMNIPMSCPLASRENPRRSSGDAMIFTTLMFAAFCLADDSRSNACA